MRSELNSGGHFFTHQFANNCFRRGMVSRSFNTKPISGKVIDKNERTAFFRAFCKKTAFTVAGQFRRIFCIVFVKSVVFFISQIRHICSLRNTHSGGFFRITDYCDFGGSGIRQAVNNLFKPTRHFIAVRSFSALTAYAGRHVFDNNNTVAHVGCKSREPFIYIAFTHKAGHAFLLCLKSSDQSEGLGMYAVISHNSAPFEPQGNIL